MYGGFEKEQGISTRQVSHPSMRFMLPNHQSGLTASRLSNISKRNLPSKATQDSCIFAFSTFAYARPRSLPTSSSNMLKTMKISDGPRLRKSVHSRFATTVEENPSSLARISTFCFM